MNGPGDVDAFGLTAEQRDAWKFGGWETITHEEALRRQRKAELLAPLWRREVGKMADAFDNMLKPAPWDSPDADPLGDMRRVIEADVDRMARDRARQVDEWLAPQMDAIRELQASGREVWLEESPPVFEADDEAHVYRATSTTRLRWAGDGLDDSSRPAPPPTSQR